MSAQQIVVAAALAVAGTDPVPTFLLGVGALVLGSVLLMTRRRGAHRSDVS